MARTDIPFGKPINGNFVMDTGEDTPGTDLFVLLRRERQRQGNDGCPRRSGRVSKMPACRFRAFSPQWSFCSICFRSFVSDVLGGPTAPVYETRGGVCVRRVAKRLKTPDSAHEKTQRFFRKNSKNLLHSLSLCNILKKLANKTARPSRLRQREDAKTGGKQ